MFFKLKRSFEPNLKAQFFSAVVGPAKIVDGVISTLTFGFVSSCIALEATKILARARMGR